ncbi:hypothetical protein LTS08_004060 [Lithohypha guttulata]|nr:hypothetical protein LTS08_004060 [Lithohypha guttulata]
MPNTSASPFVDALTNSTIATTSTNGVSLFSAVLTLLGLFDPQIVLRAVSRALLHVVIWPTIRGQSFKWEKAVLYTPVPRPASLLSDFDTITSATRFPFLNNTFADVLEGQLICLAIVAAFILVFLIREWVINQQPLLNMPDDEQGDNPAPAQAEDEPRQPARRRRRGIRQLGNNNNLQLDNRPLPAPRARPLPAPRRRATENNILVPETADGFPRPLAPQRAQSLVPALQELEFNARQLGAIGSEPAPQRPAGHETQNEPLESPPLHRGVFDDMGHIRRSIEEGDTTSSETPEVSLPTQATPLPGDVLATSTSPTFAATVPPFGEQRLAQNEFTFRSPNQPSGTDMNVEDAENAVRVENDDDWVSDLGSDVVENKQTATHRIQGTPQPGEPHPTATHDQTDDRSDTTDQNEDVQPEAGPVNAPPNEPNTLFNRLSRWLWHTEDYQPENQLEPNVPETEIVADVNAQAPFVPVHNQPAERADAAAHNGPVPQVPAPDAARNNAPHEHDVVDEAEDMEGIMELIGMEGPIAGMIQNIIFSVFLITLTLSASVWCPYIWGKIALLFIAHPFSVLVKAPLFLLSRTADFIVDIGLFTTSLFGLLLTHIAKVIRLATHPLLPSISRFFDARLLEKISTQLSSSSGTRLEKSISKALLGFRPDLPTFSVQSHHVQRVLGRYLRSASVNLVYSIASWTTRVSQSTSWQDLVTLPTTFGRFLASTPRTSRLTVVAFQQWLAQLQHDLRPLSFAKPEEIDYTLVQWTAWEKIVCIVMGYALFAYTGYLYLKIAHRVLNLKHQEKVPGILADTLRQAGGVMKVVVIIGIEMIVFPLYCGTMLDIALLPLFQGATLQSRLDFLLNTPFTALFIHWFLGTCYMFHFALFVSMCRKVMRRGVLYFIRDPDDPTFHPVRDVLERPVVTQLGKIAFSGFVYGSLLVICLGGVVSGLSRTGDILPLHWGSQDPIMIIPGDIIFYNFMLPFFLRKVDLTGKLSNIFEWWFRGCAAGLRLSDFLFGVDNDEEKSPGAFLWRRFLHVLLHERRTKHPMVRYIEELADHKHRLLWFKSDAATIDETTIRLVVGQVRSPKIFNLSSDKSQVLVQFSEEDDMADIMRKVEIWNNGNTGGIVISKVKDLSVETVVMPAARGTPVDPSAGTYVRAPAKDSVRIPKSTNIFVRVDENNNRIDGKDEPEIGRLHNKKDERFSKIFVPNHFRARITTFIGLIWTFIAVAGLIFTIGPLIFGRIIIRSVVGPSVVINDLYAVTVGIHVLVGFIFVSHQVITKWNQNLDRIGNLFKNTRQALPAIAVFLKRTLGQLYLAITVGIVLPMALSLLAELYINIPIYSYLVSEDKTGPANPLISSTQGQASPIIHILQTWIMGLLYLRVILRVMTTTPNTTTRPAIAIRNITRDGFTRPDVKLASRALVLPFLSVCIILLILPLVLARIVLLCSSNLANEELHARAYRYSYPAVLALAIAAYMLHRLRARVNRWRTKIRDEVYLIGERLHNFPAQDEALRKRGQVKNKGKGKEREKMVREDQVRAQGSGMADEIHGGDGVDVGGRDGGSETASLGQAESAGAENLETDNEKREHDSDFTQDAENLEVTEDALKIGLET